MLDDFRNQASSSPFFEEEEEDGISEPIYETRQEFLGMKPAQRFLIALIVLMLVCMIGSFFLLVTQAVAPPFL